MDLPDLKDKTVIVTGGANGIGLAVVQKYHACGANVVIADLPTTLHAANTAIKSLDDESRALFIPANVTSWSEMRAVFHEILRKFERVDIVVANAGIMESNRFFDFEVDEHGQLRENGAGRVIDVNLKGAMNSTGGQLYLTDNIAPWSGRN